MKKLVFFVTVLLFAVVLVSCDNKTEQKELNEVKILGNFDTFDPAKDHISELIKEITGIGVKYDFLPQDAGSADTKLYLDIAGQAQYHLLKLSSVQFNELRRVGALLDISKLLDEHGPNIKRTVDADVWKTTTFDEKVYGVPQLNAAQTIDSALFLRKDLLTKHSIEVPETLSEFKNALLTLKEKEGSNFVPVALSSENVQPIRGAFGIVRDWSPREDGSVMHWSETPEFEGYISYIKELVDLGLLQDGYITTPGYGSMARPGLQNGTVFATLDAWWSGNGIINGIADSTGKTQEEIIETASDYLHFIPSLKGDSAYPLSTVDKGEARINFQVLYFFAIPRYMEDYAVSVIKWMDKKLEDDNHKLLAIGEEGVHHKVIDGEYYPILEPDADGNVPFDLFNKADYFLTGTNKELYSKFWQARARKNPRQEFVWAEMNSQAYLDEFAIEDAMGLAPGFPILGSNVAKLNELVKQHLELAITGKSTQTHAQLIAKLREEAKLADATAEVNAWFKSR